MAIGRALGEVIAESEDGCKLVSPVNMAIPNLSGRSPGQTASCQPRPVAPSLAPHERGKRISLPEGLNETPNSSNPRFHLGSVSCPNGLAWQFLQPVPGLWPKRLRRIILC